MAFRVRIAGGRSFSDYPRRRATLDALLVSRLPDVQLLTGGGPDSGVKGSGLRFGPEFYLARMIPLAPEDLIPRSESRAGGAPERCFPRRRGAHPPPPVLA